MKKTQLIAGKKVKLKDLSSGSLFWCNGSIAFKTDYNHNNGACECYIVDNGSAFLGGTKNAEDLNNLEVIELDLVEIDSVELVNNIPYVPFPIAFHTVDVIALRYYDFKRQILLGRKPKQTQWQFIGGFVEPTHTAEHTAAKEFHEEAGLLVLDEARFKYFGSIHVKDERYINSPHQITSSLFTIDLDNNEEGKLVAGDDIEEIRWFTFDEANENIRSQHKEIFIKFLINFANE